jgi:hypothetical protein
MVLLHYFVQIVENLYILAQEVMTAEVIYGVRLTMEQVLQDLQVKLLGKQMYMGIAIPLGNILLLQMETFS